MDLHPAGFADSEASGIWGINQAGWGRESDISDFHALFWSGTAESVVYLHPTGFDSSIALGLSENTQVGAGHRKIPPFHPAIGLNVHALLWRGTAESVVDLHPAGFDHSEAKGVSGDVQVGGKNR